MFYAHHNPHGVGAVFHHASGKISKLPGRIYRFATRAHRDSWLAADIWDGRYHRESLTYGQVRTELRDPAAQWDSYDVNFEPLPCGMEMLTR